MRRVFPVALIICIAIASSSAQQATPAPPAPKTSSAKTDSTFDYSQEAYVVEKARTSYTFENDGTGKRELYVRVKVQSEAGVQQLGQVIFGYSSANERVEIPYVRVLKADGSIITAPADSVQDLSIPLEKEAPVYTDLRQKHITVPGLRPGDVLEYDIQDIIVTPLAPGQFWMEHDFTKNCIVLDEELEVNVPASRKVTLKTAKDRDAKITEASGRRIYSWTSSHLEKDDDDVEKKKKSKPDQDQPAVQMTTFASWEEIGRWYGGLEKEKRQPTADIRAKAAALTAGKTTDLDKMQALYDFVGPNFRYVSLSLGVGRYQPHAAGEVLHNEYGDCKDKHTLLASLLEASGYHASSVLIGTARKLDPDMPSPSQFDHVITMVPLGKEEIWMDTTTEVAPFRLLAPTIRKKQALVIPADGTPHLEFTPSDPPMPNTQAQSVDATVNDFGKLDANVKYVTRGDVELFARTIFRRVPSTKWPLLLKQTSTMMGLEGEISDIKVCDPAATHEPFQIEYKIVVANFYDWSKKKSDLAVPFSNIKLPDVDTDDDDKDDKDKDKNPDPIKLGSPEEYDFELHLQFPALYKISAPLPFSMKRDYAEYTANYAVNGVVFTAERKLSTHISELPQERSGDYTAFRRAVLADTAQHLSVDSSAASTPTASPDLKGDDLNDAANAALTRGDLNLAVELFKRVTVAEPKHKTAWINLGRSYMGLRQTDNAVQAFKHHTENNPYDELGFSNLGWAYGFERKYDDAETAYKKAIEINPLSDYAHRALGQMYSEEHQYDKATPELEKAASLKADDAGLQIALGDAYLNLGQDEKAMAAFDRAVEISATPEVWNDIAYQLALKKVHLDRAQQYAESAVEAVSAALRNVTLSQLSNRQITLVPALYSHWDTLGWVYFAQGDLDKAQKYISPSWMIGQHGEVGDHLGQIYEKRGEKDKAIQAYAMALSGLRPIPETRGRLAALLGGEDKVGAVVNQHREELQESRTVKLAKGKETGTAEFFVMLAPAAAGVNVEDVKFISGDEPMKTYGEALRTAHFNFNFPDETPTKIFRRGVLSCPKTGNDCVFVMLLPDDVRSAN